MYPQSENELEKELIQQLSSQYKKLKSIMLMTYLLIFANK